MENTIPRFCGRCKSKLEDKFLTQRIRESGGVALVEDRTRNVLNANYVMGPTVVRDVSVEKVELLDENGKGIKQVHPSLAMTEYEKEDKAVGSRTVHVVEPTMGTDLVCPDCLDPTDYIIWGVDKGVKNIDVEVPS